jgi:ubiquinone/menaquinone biosynthesis C-methylase UbiE
MTTKLTLEEVRAFWTRQAIEHGQSPNASWSDQRVIEMEIRELISRMDDGDRVLDVGCANGYSTIQFASQRAIKIRGLDYIPEMVEEARNRLRRLPAAIPGEVEFDVGNILELAEAADTYDKLVVIRVLINLGDWTNQVKALRECARVLRQGGVLLLSEATLQGWNKLNDLRREWELHEIAMPGFNSYLDEEKVINSMGADLELVELVNFASTYFVGTRLLKPLLAKAIGGKLDPADPNAEWNRWFSTLPSWGDYGTQKLFVFRKR